MKIIPKSIADVKLCVLKHHNDKRGFFYEGFRKSWFSQNQIDFEPCQFNISQSSKNILRGLHFQIIFPQAKFIIAISGTILDIAVDIRPNSPTFGQCINQILDSQIPRALFIPKGFAHGFYVLSEQATIIYICDYEYYPQYERGIIWNDPTLNIKWPNLYPIISNKDTQWVLFSSLNKQELLF